jgi:hypothetical protein
VHRIAVFACLFPGFVAIHSQAHAQAAEDRPSVLERWHPEAFPAPEPEQQSAEAPRDLALVLKLDDTGLGIASAPQLAADRLALEEAHLKVRRGRIGVGVSVLGIGVGTALLFGSLAVSICFNDDCPSQRRTASGIAVGATLMVGGFAQTQARPAQPRSRRWGWSSRLGPRGVMPGILKPAEPLVENLVDIPLDRLFADAAGQR